MYAKARTKQDSALETAFDKAVKKVPGGEYMKNLKIYVKRNGKKVKIEVDVWGIVQSINQLIKGNH